MAGGLVGTFAGLTEQQKITVGALGILLGVVMIAAMTFAGVSSMGAQIALGFAGVLLAVAGTVLLGTSEPREQIV